jgi:hypothetical protein
MEFGKPMEPVTVFNICIKETFSEALTGYHFSGMSPIQNDLKQGDAISPPSLTLLWNKLLERYEKTRGYWN